VIQLYRYFATSATCQAVTQVVRATWETNAIVDDLNDDDLNDLTPVTCESLTIIMGSDDGSDDDITYQVTGYITVGTTSGSSSSSSCFASSETVQLENGDIVTIADVVVGDRVLAADATGVPTFAKVVAVPHDAKNTVEAEFMQLVTVSGDIKLTADHLLVVSKGCAGAETQLSMAKDVVVGDCLLKASGALDAVESVIESSQGTGVHTIVTDAEYVVVNGFVASPFAHNHAVANAYYNIIRFVSKIIPANYFVGSKAFRDVNAFLGTLVTDFSA
jgi:hypothetical protein